MNKVLDVNNLSVVQLPTNSNIRVGPSHKLNCLTEIVQLMEIVDTFR